MCGESTTENLGIVSTETFRLFKEYKLREFIFVEPGGNFGDLLIYKGAEKLARLAGLSYTSVGHDEFMNSSYPKESVVYIHGSGGFVPFWSGNPIKELRKAISEHYEVVVLGPSTFSNDKAFLEKVMCSHMEKARANKTFVLCRDRVSYIVLQQCISGHVELLLDHDTALNLQREDLPQWNCDNGRFTLYAIRDDKEACEIGDRDYSAVWLDPVRYCRSFDHWLYVHHKTKKLVTNRLHSAIAGVVLEIPTVLLPNKYHKNRSVWENSLCHKGVQWTDQALIGRTGRLINQIYPLKAIAELSVFQRALRTLYRIRYRDFIRFEKTPEQFSALSH